MTPELFAEMQATTAKVFRKYVEAKRGVQLAAESLQLARTAVERAERAYIASAESLQLAEDILAKHAENVVAGADALNPRTGEDR